MANAKGNQHGVEQHSGVWSSEACLSCTLENAVPDPSGSLDTCLYTPDGKWGISPGVHLWVVLFYRYGCSGHLFRYLRCVSLLNVFSVLEVVSLLNQIVITY